MGVSVTTAIGVVALVLAIALGVLGTLREERIGGERLPYRTAKALVSAQLLLGALGAALLLLEVSQ